MSATSFQYICKLMLLTLVTNLQALKHHVAYLHVCKQQAYKHIWRHQCDQLRVSILSVHYTEEKVM